MKLAEVRLRDAALIERLLEIWEESVRATHLFLSDAEIAKIKEYVPQAISSVEHLWIAEDDDEVLGADDVARASNAIAFMGVDGTRLEMLFVAPEKCGKGVGRSLVEKGFSVYGMDEVTVNEQNPAALGFYRHFGFREYRRTETDEEGGPYPLLYLRREG